MTPDRRGQISERRQNEMRSGRSLDIGIDPEVRKGDCVDATGFGGGGVDLRKPHRGR
jgi:hypothetical protein